MEMERKQKWSLVPILIPCLFFAITFIGELVEILNIPYVYIPDETYVIWACRGLHLTSLVLTFVFVRCKVKPAAIIFSILSFSLSLFFVLSNMILFDQSFAVLPKIPAMLDLILNFLLILYASANSKGLATAATVTALIFSVFALICALMGTMFTKLNELVLERWEQIYFSYGTFGYYLVFGWYSMSSYCFLMIYLFGFMNARDVPRNRGLGAVLDVCAWQLGYHRFYLGSNVAGTFQSFALPALIGGFFLIFDGLYPESLPMLIAGSLLLCYSIAVSIWSFVDFIRICAGSLRPATVEVPAAERYAPRETPAAAAPAAAYRPAEPAYRPAEPAARPAEPACRPAEPARNSILTAPEGFADRPAKPVEERPYRPAPKAEETQPELEVEQLFSYNAAAAQTGSLTEKQRGMLEALQDLHDSGMLSDEAYEQKRAEIVSGK